MSLSKLKELIENMGPATRVNRENTADIIIANASLFHKLIEVSFEIDYKLHYKAAWLLEVILERDIELLLPKIDYFTSNIGKLKHQSAIRPISKICNWLARSFVKKNNPAFLDSFSKVNLNQIIETSFDWMIGDTKVATKAYTMDALYFWGLIDSDETKWIHRELKNIIIQNITNESAAYKARGRMTLDILNKASTEQ